MPIYEYGCDQGCTRIELIRRMAEADQSVEHCPKCGQARHRLVSRTSFTLVGAGWARDNYGVAGVAGTTTTPP